LSASGERPNVFPIDSYQEEDAGAGYGADEQVMVGTAEVILVLAEKNRVATTP
jgi:hypothetical protein